jgi:hypothetical protein
MVPSRLGEPAPQARSGAARFAVPAPQPLEKKPEGAELIQPIADDILTLKRQNVETPKREKQPMTIRLTPGAIDRLSEIERSLRRSGIRARRASASEIVEALVEAADIDELRLQLKKKPT